MYNFDIPWTEEIAEDTASEEYQNAKIEIKDSSVKAEYDVETDEFSFPNGQPNLYSGRARVQVVRWGVFSGGESQANAKVATSIRVQLPKNAIGRVQRGNSIIVTECTDSPALEGTIYNVFSSAQSSWTASRTFEAQLDGDSNEF